MRPKNERSRETVKERRGVKPKPRDQRERGEDLRPGGRRGSTARREKKRERSESSKKVREGQVISSKKREVANFTVFEKGRHSSTLVPE